MRKQPSRQNIFAKFTSVLAIAALSLFGITPAASANGGLVLEFPSSATFDIHLSYPSYVAEFEYQGGGGLNDQDAVWSITPSNSAFMLEEAFSSQTFTGYLYLTDEATAGTYTLSVSLTVAGSAKGSISLTISVFDDELSTTTTNLTGDIGVRPGDRIFASALKRTLSTDFLSDPSAPALREYVYRLSTKPNDMATLVDPQPIDGYQALTLEQQDSWYLDLGYTSEDPYAYNWATYICANYFEVFRNDAEFEFELPTNMRVEYASLESTLVSGDVDRGLLAAFISKAGQRFASGSVIGQVGNAGFKGDWQGNYDNAIYGLSDVTGDCAAGKELELVVLGDGDPESSRDFLVPDELVGYTASVGDTVAFSSIGATIVVISDGDFLYGEALWGVTQVLGSQTPAVAAPYAGPVVFSVTNEAAAGDQVTVTGSRLSSVTSVSIDGISIAVTNATDESFSFVLPEGITPGIKDITIVSSAGSLSSQQSLTVVLQSQRDQSVTAWTKLLPNGSVKVYAKNIVGAGKVQFKVNGEEIAWVRAVDEADPKLRFASDSYYLVRTVELSEGKNAIEIFVDGERQRRAAYSS